MPYTGGYPRATELQVARGRYDFSVDGGAVGTIDLTRDAQIPANAIILGGFVEVDTALTSGGAGTMAVSVEGAGDIVAAAAVSGAPWSTTGRKSTVPAFTGATTVKTTQARKIQATIATAALTAGVFDVVVVFVELPD
ncbi:hypothetical protein [Nonomuraea angiospora]|uniref:hypothetical protein n=1 Tax=Nonomuraea angiospora TaxID=46172 RepID=UPI0029A0E0EE|nr:hypothetical protein [Nonomuraea angiospora]MDX3101745.1 hypothetical protein [Nonomuraea angiospora]